MKNLVLLGSALVLSASVLATEAEQIVVQDPYVRLAPPNAPATGAFMVFRNEGKQNIKIVKAENPVSKLTELHTHLNDGGVMRMRQIPSIDVPAQGEAVLKPGGMHVMLIDLKAPMKEGDIVPFTLTLGDGSTRKFDARVMRPTGAGMPMEHKH